ncbi:MAG: peptide ABC transporter permease [Acidimicrobiales bacterium]|nr:MAG: peptide ABC transporter permease [Acidimicrobiales bacterium]
MKYALTRLAQAVVILIVVTFLTFWMQTLLPGNPCIVATGGLTSDELVAKCEVDLKVGENVFVRYADWGTNFISGDLGESYVNGRTVWDDLKQRFPPTGFLFLYSQVVALGVAVPGGIWAAYMAGRKAKRNIPTWLPFAIVGGIVAVSIALGTSVFTLILLAIFATVVIQTLRGGAAQDQLVSASAFFLLSVPVVVLAIVGQWLFAIRWNLYDLSGYTPPSEGLFDHVKSLWLPSVVIGLSLSPVYLRLLRADMIQNLQQDFVNVAKAKGMPPSTILLRHVLRPSTLTLLTVAGLNVAQLVNGAVIVEVLYDVDGMGSYLVSKFLGREFIVVQTLVALIATIFVLANLAVDLFYGVVDPRVRVERSKG